MGPLIVAACGLIAAPQFVIEPPGCSPPWLSVTALEDMLRADTSSTTRAFVAVLAPDCAELDTLELSVIRAGRPPRQGRVQLSGVPDALKLRTLALVAGELLVEASLVAPPRQPIVPARPRATPLDDSGTETKPWSLAAAGEVRATLTRGDVSLGGRLELAYRTENFRVGGGAAFATATGPRAQLVLASVHLFVVAGVRAGRWDFELGPMAETGVARLTGRASDAEPDRPRALSSMRALVWLGARADVGVRVGGSWSAGASLALGGHVLGVQGVDDDEVLVSSSGASLRGGLTLARAW